MKNLNISPGIILKIRTLKESIKARKLKKEDLDSLIELKYLGEGKLEEYQQLKQTISLFQKNLEKYIGQDLLVYKMINSLSKKEPTNLNEEQQYIFEQINISIERQLLIIAFLLNEKYDLTTNQSKEEKDLYKYVIMNFYRTLCEITPKFFYPNLADIIDFLSPKYKEELNLKVKDSESYNEILGRISDFKKWREDISRGSVDLNSLRIVLNAFENKTSQTGLAKAYETHLGYIAQGNKDNPETGFVLRNTIAHEKSPFDALSITENLSPNIESVQMFNVALILGLYLDILGSKEALMNAIDLSKLEVELKPFFDIADQRF